MAFLLRGQGWENDTSHSVAAVGNPESRALLLHRGSLPSRSVQEVPCWKGSLAKTGAALGERWSWVGPGDQGRLLHRRTEMSVLTMTSQQNPPLFFSSFPFECCLFCILLGAVGRRRFQTHGWSPLSQRDHPAPPWLYSPASGARSLVTFTCTNSRRRRPLDVRRFVPQDGCAWGPSWQPSLGRRRKRFSFGRGKTEAKKRPLGEISASPAAP